ncbi:MAG: hypothetical protein DRP11_01810 [Candidatus Aenigmatarchaeota archaeon]|nr:MAG: hypothetical protein DRP11_01810 [Candidatus Aenigmarchaeota archaeon]
MENTYKGLIVYDVDYDVFARDVGEELENRYSDTPESEFIVLKYDGIKGDRSLHDWQELTRRPIAPLYDIDPDLRQPEFFRYCIEVGAITLQFLPEKEKYEKRLKDLQEIEMERDRWLRDKLGEYGSDFALELHSILTNARWLPDLAIELVPGAQSGYVDLPKEWYSKRRGPTGLYPFVFYRFHNRDPDCIVVNFFVKPWAIGERERPWTILKAANEISFLSEYLSGQKI